MEAKQKLFDQYPDAILITELIAGSHMYGTSNENSDTDTRGVFIPPVENIIGLHKVDQVSHEAEDIKYYSLHYFIHLLVKGIMDAHDWLWAESHTLQTEEFKHLVELKEKFLSGTMGKKIFGYMTSADRRIDRGDPAAWGEKRRNLFKTYGYDTKDASHAVRLAYQGIRLYDEGVFHPKLPDKQVQEVIEIKMGEYSLDHIRTLVQSLKKKLNEAIENNKANIPQKPDVKLANGFLIDTYRQHV